MSFLNKTGLERLWQHIILKLGDKVDKVDGKGLSTNDYTTAEKEKLASLTPITVDDVIESLPTYGGETIVTYDGEVERI